MKEHRLRAVCNDTVHFAIEGHSTALFVKKKVHSLVTLTQTNIDTTRAQYYIHGWVLMIERSQINTTPCCFLDSGRQSS